MKLGLGPEDRSDERPKASRQELELTPSSQEADDDCG